MLCKTELREGNYVLANLLIGCSLFSEAIVKLNSLDSDSVSLEIDYPDSEYIEEETVSYDFLQPILLNKEWRTVLNVNFEYPSYIKYVHELQNWYFWNNKKKEIDSSSVQKTGGDNLPNNCLEKLISFK
jgi:hypothetical protein